MHNFGDLTVTNKQNKQPNMYLFKNKYVVFCQKMYEYNGFKLRQEGV